MLNTRRRGTDFIVCLAMALVLSSAAPMKRAQSSPRLVLLQSVVLIETDSAFIGRVRGAAVTRSGSYLIGDALNLVVHEFSAQGKHLRTIGRRGRGPGEFTAVGVMAVEGDSLLFVDGGAQLQVFDYRSGKPRWQRRLPAPQSLTSIAVRDSRVFFNAVDRTRRSTVGVAVGQEDSARYGGPFPEPLGRNRLVDQFLSYVQLAQFHRDSLAVVTMASDFVFLGKFGEAHFDSVRIGRLTRRGSRPDLIRTMTEDPATVQPHVYSFSVPWGLAKLSAGSLAYVATDQTFMTNRLAGTLYLSVVDVRARQTCPDAEIPVPKDPHPWVLFRGDTLITISQDVTADANPRTTVRKFAIFTEGCRWLR